MSPWPHGWRLGVAVAWMFAGLGALALPLPWLARVPLVLFCCPAVFCAATLLVLWPWARWDVYGRNGALRFVVCGRGFRAWFLRLIRAAADTEFAITIGPFVCSTAPVEELPWEAHELRHVKQGIRLGPFLMPVWALGGLGGYHDAILERDARSAEEPES